MMVGLPPVGTACAVCVAWSGFRQNSAASSHLVVEPVETHQPSYEGAARRVTRAVECVCPVML
jgi:hypothetical protein